MAKRSLQETPISAFDIKMVMPGRITSWLAFYAAIIFAWIFLLYSVGRTVPTAPFDAQSWWDTLCTVDATMAQSVLMWAVMVLAMMGPAGIPFLISCHRIQEAGAAQGSSFLACAIGYLSVWVAYAFIAGIAQYYLNQSGLLDGQGRLVSGFAAAGFCLAAALYQFHGLKIAAVKACISPMTFCIGRWRPGFTGSLRLGAEYGLLCLACCWALMLLAFAGGTMNLMWMSLIMVIMLLERFPAIGERMRIPIGVGLLVGAFIPIIDFVTGTS